MNQEVDQQLNIQNLFDQVEAKKHLYSSPPTSQELIDGHNALLHHKIETSGPKILTHFRRSWLDRKEKQRILIEESNTLQPGEPNYLGRLHNAMNSRHPRARNIIFDNDLRYEEKKKKKNKGKWGIFRNQSRKDLEPGIQRGFERMVNSKLQRAEQEDRNHFY
jgi:hypothetical protein